MWQTMQAWTSENTWIVHVFVVVFLVLLFNFMQGRILRRIAQRFEKTRNPWDDAVTHALQRPLSLFIWVVGIAFAAEIVAKESGAAVFAAIAPVRDVGVVATIAWFLVRLTGNVQKNVVAAARAKGKPYDHTTIDAIAKLVRASVFITAALVALQTLGFSISGVLAFGGVGGIAVGFAAKDLLANFFGGLMIYLDRPFSVGDWIRSPDRDIEGTVESIGWRLTRIRTFDKRPIFVPNSTFTTITVENPSRMSHRRIYETIGIRYDDVDKLPAVITDVEKMLKDHQEIDASQTLMVNFNSFAPSSLDFFVYTFTHTTNWIKYHQIKEDVLLRIHEIIKNHGAEIAFPTSTVHIADQIQLGPAGINAAPEAT